MSEKQKKEAFQALGPMFGAPPGAAPDGFKETYDFANELIAKMGLDKKESN